MLTESPYRVICRRRSLLGGYTYHVEALQESRMRKKQDRQRVKEGLSSSSSSPALGANPDEEPITSSSPTIASPPTIDNGHVESKKHDSATLNTVQNRRSSDILRVSAKMPGNEGDFSEKSVKCGVVGTGGGMAGGGLARCQRVWKMIPQTRDHRPVWLKQYEVKACHVS